MSAVRKVKLTRSGPRGFGFNITGGHPGPIVISKVKEGTPAEGQLEVGEHLVALDGVTVLGLTQIQVVSLVKQASESLVLSVKTVKNARKDMSALTQSPRTARRSGSDAAPAAVSAEPVVEDKVPEEIQQRINAVVKRVTDAAASLGVNVKLPAAGDFLDQLAQTVELLEKGTDSLSSDVMQRLAAVVARLERAVPTGGHVAGGSSSGAPIQRLADVVHRIEKAAGGGPKAELKSADLKPSVLSASGNEEDEHPSVVAFDAFLAEQVRAYLDLSNQLGGVVAGHAQRIVTCFICMRRLLAIVPSSQKPGPKVLPQLYEAINSAVDDARSFADTNFDATFQNHLKAVGDAILAFNWINIEPKPAPFVTDMADAAEYYGNRIIKDNKDKDSTQCDWARSWTAVLKALAAYIKSHHTTGLAWGNKMRSMTFWSNAIAQTAPGEGDPDRYIYNYKLGAPISHA